MITHATANEIVVGHRLAESSLPAPAESIQREGTLWSFPDFGY
jgi:hypothetical protein